MAGFLQDEPGAVSQPHSRPLARNPKSAPGHLPAKQPNPTHSNPSVVPKDYPSGPLNFQSTSAPLQALGINHMDEQGMEVHVRNVAAQTNDKTLRNFLKPVFAKLSIQNVNCQKNQGKTFASITFLNIDDGQRFLARHGQVRATDRRQRAPRAVEPLTFYGSPIYFERSNRIANPYLIRVLKREADERMQSYARHQSHASQPHYPSLNMKSAPTVFKCTSLSCGVWSADTNEVVFAPQQTWEFDCIATFGERIMKLDMSSGIRVDFRYTSILEITTEDSVAPAITLTMWEAPRFFKKIENPVEELLSQLNLQQRLPSNQLFTPNSQRKGPDRQRLPCIDGGHKLIAGCCLVYRVALRSHQYTPFGLQIDLGGMLESLGKSHGMPAVLHQTTRVCNELDPYIIGFKRLQSELASLNSKLPFELKFQIQRLSQDGYLSPFAVLDLLPTFTSISQRASVSVSVSTARKFADRIQYWRPETDPADFVIETLIGMLQECNSSAAREEKSGYEMATTPENVASIHRARVTPSAVRLHGPEPESNNRVLRRYPNHHGHFLRVQFCDEDGLPIRFNPRISNEAILHGRFKDVLKSGILIAERNYTFLGYSHSSLRAQTVWFYTPFVYEEQLHIYENIIEDLGNFSEIRSPAKCAARIGQTFSDTRIALKIPLNAVHEVADVKRNDRVFSDGVGTISASMHETVCAALRKKVLPKPTVLQIRFQGAKGMISLDSRLRGDVLTLRGSMIKFRGSKANDLEICEAAYKPLPMYLNRQFIKILEDMGVEEEYFLDLQAKEIARLRSVASRPEDAAKFLRQQSVGEAVQLPWLIGALEIRGLDFRQDGFLRDIVELSLLCELRKLKHQSRIPVPKGYHLHGLMDETGYLEEGQIFCIVIENGRPHFVVGKNLIVSRAPALHPGDVQLVEGVMPPADSPLMNLSNCICFSQKGDRDLPSKLSGGDLDGDRYYIMWDEKAQPKRTFKPADYPKVEPVDIGRRVRRDDMTDFFINFMESDQLGRIAVNHRIRADQKPEGTNDPDCLLLAEMHSTAVDFSKTGIPVDMSKMPKGNAYRPDFEAPGPHVHIEKNEGVQFDAITFIDPMEQEDEDDEFSSYRYYRSRKVLGKLYRAIDERGIFDQIQMRANAEGVARRSTIMDQLWEYVNSRVKLIEWDYLLDAAREIRDMYENCLLAIMDAYSQHPSRPLSELEAFTGQILGKTGAPSKHQRELSKTMKEKFDVDMAFIIQCIVKDGDEWSDEALPRSIACFAVSLEDNNPYKGKQHLSSFKYVAATVCLREVDRLPGWEDLVDLPY